ncbi:hypothetical protein ONS95_003906 [Cadophora gregata]|uniref:uncharacterized protein n=1 Tax=Cadophora gregata TaxID=51156 RepID=UPI0026DB1A4E|nr:uncharacterized protein ONS95_003906 [Cadophora gregata]KAK0107204.1 hypothetical protein ONS95_003906 [Cadophora gregata]KAK0116886.1 hypothetical protein ONS96_012732 [Cadophora gregata f. sp. sojae]
MNCSSPISLFTRSHNNDYLTGTVQDIQGRCHDRKFAAAAKAACGYTVESPQESVDEVALYHLLTMLMNGTRPDVEDYSVSLAADVAAAYYKVALKKVYRRCERQCCRDMLCPTSTRSLLPSRCLGTLRRAGR